MYIDTQGRPLSMPRTRRGGYGPIAITTNMMKINRHSICEIEDFVETHFCKLCVSFSDRAYYWVCNNNQFKNLNSPVYFAFGS